MKHAALITISVQQPIAEADSRFINKFPAVSCSLEALTADCRPQCHVHTNHSNYFGAPGGRTARLYDSES